MDEEALSETFRTSVHNTTLEVSRMDKNSTLIMRVL